MQTPERKVKNSLISFLKDKKAAGFKIYYEVREAGGFTYRKGLPDMWLVFNGRHIELEIKKPGGKRSTLQLKWEIIFKELGIEYYCIDSVEDLELILSLG